MKHALLAVGSLLLLALVVAGLWPRGEESAAEVASAVAERAPSSDEAAAPEFSAERSETDLGPVGSTDAGRGEAADAGAPVRALAGTFVVERASGRVDAAAAGEFVLVLQGAGGEHLAVVPVRAQSGRWRSACPAACAARLAYVEVTGVRVDGAALVLLAPARPVPADVALEIRAREARPTLLHVVDARTGVELDGVELLRSLGRSLAVAPLDPALRDSARVGRGLSSPIDLAALTQLPPGGAELLVGVAGYAWTPIAVEVGAGTERTVELAAGGELRLRVEGDVRAEAPVAVVLRRSQPPDGRPLAARSVTAPTTLVLDGLAGAEYTLTAELGRPGQATELGSVTVAVAPGGVSDATLVVAPQPNVQRAPVSGLLLVPQAWELESPEVDVQALSPLLSGQRGRVELEVDPADGEPGFDAFRFSHPGLDVGRYSLGVRVPPLRIEFDLPPAGLADLRVVAPPPAQLVVRLHESETGAPVRPALLYWAASRDGQPIGSMEAVSYASDLDGYRIVSVPGEVVLLPEDEDGIELPEPVVPLPAGSSEASVPATRQTELEVVLLDNGVPQPFPEGWRVRFFRPEEQEPLEVLLRASTVLRRAQLPAGGRYRIEFDPFPGYQPLPALEFEARQRQRSRIEVRLER